MRSIEGDFDLDQLREDVVIDGDLHVSGNILNVDSDDGRRLHVHGNLRARNLVLGGAWVRVDGDANIDELVLRHSDGRLIVEGATHARLIYEHDDDRPGMPFSDHLHRDIPIERDEEQYPIAFERVDVNAVIARLRAGLSALRDPDDPRPRKSYEQWLADCTRYGVALWDVPRELLTDELIDAALASNPYGLPSIPEEWRTAERCRIAVQFEGRALQYVPVALRTPELCALAIERDTRVSEVLRHIPPEHFTHELCLRAAQRDGLSLGVMPERFRTFDVCVAALNESMFVENDIPAAIRDEVVKAWRGFRSRPSAPADPRRD